MHSPPAPATLCVGRMRWRRGYFLHSKRHPTADLVLGPLDNYITARCEDLGYFAAKIQRGSSDPTPGQLFSRGLVGPIPLPPRLLAERYVKPGDCVLDFGCGPGFFTREFARRVGESGTVIAVDLQEEMLRILRRKLEPEGLLPRIRTQRCEPGLINLPGDLNGTIDAAFTIFVVHEVPDPVEAVPGDRCPPQAGRNALLYRAPVHCPGQGIPGQPRAG